MMNWFKNLFKNIFKEKEEPVDLIRIIQSCEIQMKLLQKKTKVSDETTNRVVRISVLSHIRDKGEYKRMEAALDNYFESESTKKARERKNKIDDILKT